MKNDNIEMRVERLYMFTPKWWLRFTYRSTRPKQSMLHLYVYIYIVAAGHQGAGKEREPPIMDKARRGGQGVATSRTGD